MIQIKLISASNELYLMCREILAETSLPEWTLFRSTDCEPASSADLHIWDYVPEMQFPDGVRQHLSQHLFLVHRADLEDFHMKMASAGASIILQPASRAALSYHLTLAVCPNEARGPKDNSIGADRDEMLQRLIQVNLRLQEYDLDRTNFLSRAVHDFRTPLTALCGHCSLMLCEPLGELNENQREVIRRMQHSVKRLSRMADAMFELSVGRLIKRIPDMRPADIRACVDQAIHEIMPVAESRHIAVSVDLDFDTHQLYFEPGQIEQVLINILDNACKFTPRRGEIKIRGYSCFWERREPRDKVSIALDRRSQAFLEPNSYRIDIQNSGSQIPREQLTGIFEEYRSYGGNRDRLGAGLGLAICDRILRQHNGGIWAENTDAGPLFAFVLPFYKNR